MSSPLVFSGVRDARSFVFCVVFCRSLFVLLAFFSVILLRFVAFHYTFRIFKHFLDKIHRICQNMNLSVSEPTVCRYLLCHNIEVRVRFILCGLNTAQFVGSLFCVNE